MKKLIVVFLLSFLITNTIFNYNSGKIIIRKSESDNHIMEISLKEFYPLLTLENEEECSVSGKLGYGINSGKAICRFCFNKKYIKYKKINSNKKIREYFSDKNIANDRRIREKLVNFCCEEENGNCDSMKTIKQIRNNNHVQKRTN